MKGLSLDTDLTFLRGRELLQVCIGSNEVQMNFDEEVRITIESTCEYFENDVLLHEIENYKNSANIICVLVGLVIIDAKVDSAGGFSLLFDGLRCLHVLNSVSNYESFSITNRYQQLIG